MEKKTILVVDDEKINRTILGKMLSDDYNIIYASNGVDALGKLRESVNRIAAVLLDIIMPEMDGYQLLSIIHSDRALSQIPVIISSQRDDDETEIKALSLGAQDFIAKPYKRDIICHRLANIIKFRETAALINTARRDELTGLYNKIYFLKKVRETIDAGSKSKYRMYYIDIERFKVINDTLGTQSGDGMLCHIASKLKEAVGENGICARFNADDFYIFSGYTDEQSHGELIKMISEDRLLPHNMNVKLRCGIYETENAAIPVNVMCDRAQSAADTIKGKYDRYIAYYDDSLRQRIISEQFITEQMENALESDQFKVYYQPKYELSSERISGAEALVRWQHPTNGTISPGEFIPLFEKNGFITKLDKYVWESVCRDLSEMRDAGIGLVPVSVNVSRADLYDSSLVETLCGFIDKYEIACRYIHLEITETAYAEDPEHIVAVIKRLRDYGFTIEMDDFGSGYSSLNMLSEMPIDVLKLDTRFIQREAVQTTGKGILSFIISLAKWLGLSVVAEGVENREQINILKTMDCDYVQGYYYARPMPKKEYLSLLGSKVARIQHKDENLPEGVPEKKKADPLEKIMLIVDDVEINRAVLTQIFEGQYRIIEASDGKEAQRRLNENADKTAVVLLDLLMPVMDGFQLLKEIRSNNLTRDIPVIATSQDNRVSEMNALELGADDFIAKPYDADTIRRCVEHVVIRTGYLKKAIEKRVKYEIDAVRRMSERDELTELYNRGALEERVSSHYIVENSVGAVFLMIDIDNFKEINDNFGHLKGDSTLKKTAGILRRCLRAEDIIARTGGDEFAVFIAGDIERGELEKLLRDLCRQLNIKIDSFDMTCSIGACVSPQYGNDFQTLYNNADMALLCAKHRGKNQYQIYDGHSELPSHILYRNMGWLLNESGDSIMITEAKSFEVLYMNLTAGEMIGKNSYDCIGKKCYEVLWNASEPCSHCIKLAELRRAPKEYEISPENSGRVYFVNEKLIDWDGIPARLQYTRDVTERAEMISKLKEISDERKDILQFAPGGIFRYFADDDNDFFDYVSESMLKMLGYTRDAFDKKFGGRFSGMIWHEDRRRVLDEIKAQISQSDNDRVEYRIEKSDGTLMWVADEGHIITPKNGIGRYYVTIIDITKLKKSEAELEYSNALLDTAADIGNMLYFVYDARKNSCRFGKSAVEKYGFPAQIDSLTDYLTQNGIMANEDISAVTKLRDRLIEGAENARATVKLTLKAQPATDYNLCCRAVKTHSADNIIAFCTIEALK